jgi:hypothetical protein
MRRVLLGPFQCTITDVALAGGNPPIANRQNHGCGDATAKILVGHCY